MASFKERLKTLEDFPPLSVLEILDEKRGVEFVLTFIPNLNIFIIKRSDSKGEPLVAISYGVFQNACKRLNLNPKNKLDSIIKSVMDAWDNTDEQIKMAFFDGIPLNSLFIGRQYI